MTTAFDFTFGENGLTAFKGTESPETQVSVSSCPSHPLTLIPSRRLLSLAPIHVAFAAAHIRVIDDDLFPLLIALVLMQSFLQFLGEENLARLVNFCMHYIANLEIPRKR